MSFGSAPTKISRFLSTTGSKWQNILMLIMPLCLNFDPASVILRRNFISLLISVKAALIFVVEQLPVQFSKIYELEHSFH